jgi:hypothetical protein
MTTDIDHAAHVEWRARTRDGSPAGLADLVPPGRDVSTRARDDTGVEDTVRVRCPYCREWVDLYVDPDTTGTLVEDCAVCCRPWAVTVERDAGRLRVHVTRAQ